MILCTSHGREKPECNYIVTHSQTKSIDHELSVIFFLVSGFHELLNTIIPGNTLIWLKYENERNIFD